MKDKVSLLLILCISITLCYNYDPPNPVDDPDIFFENTIYTTYIRAFPKYNRVMRLPWSGDYLAHRYGGPSARYGDMDTRYKPYPISVNMYHQPGDYLANKDRPDFSDYVNKYYSPAEKYDLYVGDYEFTLTRTAKYYGRKFNGGGDFSSWMGLCHGLSPASYMVPTPINAVTVIGADGKTKIRFLPDDIKALATTWWGNVKFKNRLTGKRYFPINAASFLIIYGNQIGRFRKNICVEPYADAEIWNFGAVSYEMKYYNLNTGKEGLYTDSKIAVNQSRPDIASAASEGATNVIGVKMTISYAKDYRAKHTTPAQTMKEDKSNYSMAIYVDDKDLIKGGVWLSRAKPSYVWGPKSIPNGPYDKYLPTFAGGINRLNSITEYAKKSSAQYLPLRSIVYYLASMS